MATISIIIINWNTQELLRQCLDSIQNTCASLEIEILVVDNASTDGSIKMVQREYPDVRLILNETNQGFAKANNQAMRESRADFFLLLNSDALLTPGALQAMLQLSIEQPAAGIVGPQLQNPDQSFQASYTSFPSLWREFLILSGLGRLLFGRWFPSHGPQVAQGSKKVDYVEGASLFVRRNAYQQVGGLDESFFMYSEEVDWCYCMKQAGWDVWYQPLSVVTHYGGGSSMGRRTQREGDLYWSRIHFFRKHYGPAAAERLKSMIIVFTGLKYAVHAVINNLSKGRYGRTVISMQELTLKLKNA